MGASEWGRCKYIRVALRLDMTAMDGGNAARGRMPELSCLAKPHSDAPIRPTLSTTLIRTAAVQNQKKKSYSDLRMFFSFDVDFSLALDFDPQ